MPCYYIGGFTVANFWPDYLSALLHGDQFYLYYVLVATLQLYLLFPAMLWLFKNEKHHGALLLAVLLFTVTHCRRHQVWAAAYRHEPLVMVVYIGIWRQCCDLPILLHCRWFIQPTRPSD